MVANIRSLIVGTLLVALFIYAMIAGSINLSSDNDSNSSLLQNTLINKTFSDLGANLSKNQEVASNQREGFETEIPTIGTDSFLFSSVIATGKTFTSKMSNIFNSTFGLIISTLGLSNTAGAIILGTLIAIILITIIALLWSWYKVGR